MLLFGKILVKKSGVWMAGVKNEPEYFFTLLPVPGIRWTCLPAAVSEGNDQMSHDD